MFVFTADIQGIERFEKILGIKQNTSDLEARRLNVAAKLNSSLRSIQDIENLINQYVVGVKLLHNNKDMELMQIRVDMPATGKDKLYTISNIIDNTIPVNISIEIAATEKTEETIYIGGYASTAKLISIQ